MYALHHSHRLRKNEEFQVVFQKGKSCANKHFVVYAMPREGQAPFRIGISISKKIGNAIIRNRVKRYIRESVMSLEDKILAGVDLVLIVRQGIDQLPLETLRNSLAHVLKRAQVLKPDKEARVKRG
jgi:ribonuclease P protein component